MAVAFAAFGLSMQAQDATASKSGKGFKIGVNAQLPTGDVAEFTPFGLGLDVAYLFEVSENFDAGVATGFSNIFVKSDFNDFLDPFQYLPIAAAATGRFNATEDFSLGADLGYAVGISEGFDGGFYYKPLVGYMISDAAQLNLSYVGISIEDLTFSTLNFGVLFSL